MNQDSRPTFPQWSEIQNEPYRLLFPLGFALAAIGIGVWIPYYFRPQAFPNPGQGHAIVQIQGFLLCYILGFLSTMLPKVLGVAPLGRFQLSLFPLGFIGIAICAWIPSVHAQAAVQVLHGLIIANFLVFILRRWPTRRGSPPTTFAFIPMAFGADLIGTALRILAATGMIGGAWMRFPLLLQYQAFPLLLILGIGGFLLPKLFGNTVVNPQALRNQSGYSIRIPLAMGSILLASYGLEAIAPYLGMHTWPLRLAYLMRAILWAGFILGQLRLQRVPRKLPAYLTGARLSLYSMGLGMAMPIFLPRYLIAWEHLIFLSGFLWLTLSVASRVISAHAGRLEILDLHRRKSLAYGILILMAIAGRITADIWMHGHWLHLACASAFALAALAIWGWIFLPLILHAPTRPAR